MGGRDVEGVPGPRPIADWSWRRAGVLGRECAGVRDRVVEKPAMHSRYCMSMLKAYNTNSHSEVCPTRKCQISEHGCRNHIQKSFIFTLSDDNLNICSSALKGGGGGGVTYLY